MESGFVKHFVGVGAGVDVDFDVRFVGVKNACFDVDYALDDDYSDGCDDCYDGDDDDDEGVNGEVGWCRCPGTWANRINVVVLSGVCQTRCRQIGNFD